jgi:outer membrane protein TolC
MRKLSFILAMALSLMHAGLAQAQSGDGEAGLPTKADVTAALDASPGVRAALARANAARAEAQVLSRGPHEFTLTTTYASRTVNDGTGVANGRFNEFSAEVSRPIRLPGKAALDREIGQQGVTYASNMAEDARHQAALLLAQDWWDWMGAAQEAKVDAQAVKNAQELLASVRRRVALRDASRLEEDQAAAAVGAAAAQASRSAGRVVVSRARLTAQFPALPMPVAAPDAPVPSLPPGALRCCTITFLGKVTSWPQHRPLPVRQRRRRTVPARSEGGPHLWPEGFLRKGRHGKGRRPRLLDAVRRRLPLRPGGQGQCPGQRGTGGPAGCAAQH